MQIDICVHLQICVRKEENNFTDTQIESLSIYNTKKNKKKKKKPEEREKRT